MTHPIFFSFAGDSKPLAESLKGRFADDLIYMYARTGVDGTNFPDEILEEIAQCELFVIFWTASYVQTDPRRPWCRRELLTARKRVLSGSLKSFLIVQADATTFDTEVVDPDSGLLIDALKPFRDERRAFVQPLNAKAIEQRIAFELSKLNDDDVPTLPRPAFQKLLRDALKTDGYQTKTPIIFVSGFHGSGRKTLVRSVMSLDFRHLTEFTLALDGADGPEDLLRLIWGEVLQKTVSEQRQLMKDVEKDSSVLVHHYKRLPMLLVERRAYIILAKDELTDIGESIPFWATEYLKLLLPVVQPLIFLAIPRPLPPSYRRPLQHAQAVDVPTLEDEDSESLVTMHIGARDPKRVARWESHIPFILDAGANSPKLLADIVRMASRKASLDFLQQDAAADIARFDERVTKIVEWSWAQVQGQPNLLLLLDVLNTLTVGHIDTFNELFKQGGTEIGASLYTLVQLGLVEHLSESTYRVPPALRRKLNFYLVNSDLRQQTAALLKRYAKFVEIGNDETGAVALTNLLHIRLNTDTTIVEEDSSFVTAAMLFKVGWQKYRKTQYGAALNLLKRAFQKLPRVKDESTKLEIARYYGLAAAREGSDSDLAVAIRFLSRAQNFIPRVFDKAKPIASFLRGFSYRLNQQFSEALECYEQSLSELPDGAYMDAQRSVVMNEMVQCLLKLNTPEYAKAVAMAEKACAIRSTANNLDVLLRALLAQTFEDSDISEEQVQRNFEEMDRREHQLRVQCEVSHLSFHSSRVVDRLVKEAIENVNVDNLPFGALDLTDPIRMSHEAYLRYQEEAILSRKWDLMLQTEVGRDWSALHAEVSRYLDQGSLNRLGRGVAARIRILTFNMTVELERRAAYAELEKYRANNTIPRSVATDIRRKLDLGDLRNTRLDLPGNH
ncbi:MULTISPECIES: toll/interleukin-1 receptor domain-containing protein [unclassified Acidovorax]|uniref:TIR domain-containing protein n=1 Tax=unclassified Acidovorax TaxID=2684926 RepID=UPI001C48AD69|nr:TIR domain-containing protein [Acidovorax sp. sif0732]MBV7447906.1 TIR domain-containing protein [Acidovorax sp. sif0715]